MRSLFALFVICAACSRHEQPQAFRLRFPVWGPLPALEPGLGSSYGLLVKDLVFQRLVEPAGAGAWRSRFFDEWRPLRAGAYLLKPKSGLAFSDGSPVGIADFAASLRAAGLRVTERDRWLEIEPQSPDLPMEPQLFVAVLFRGGPGNYLGNGPFLSARYDGKTLLLRRREALPGRIAEVELVAVRTPREGFAAALRRDVNGLLMPDLGQIELLEGVPHLRTIRREGVHQLGVVFNARRLSKSERKGLSEALPVATLAEAYGENCRLEGAPRTAPRLSDGPPLNVGVAESHLGMLRAGLALRRALGKRGGELFPEPIDAAERRAAAGLFDLMVVPVLAWPPSVATARWVTGAPYNWGGYSNPALDEAVQSGDFTRAQQELQDDPPALFICRMERTAAIDSRVKNATLGHYDMLETLPDWEVGQ